MSRNGHDFDDALARARAEVRLELDRFIRRLKSAAEAKVQMAFAQGATDGPEVGRAAALEALSEGFWTETPALTSGE